MDFLPEITQIASAFASVAPSASFGQPSLTTAADPVSSSASERENLPRLLQDDQAVNARSPTHGETASLSSYCSGPSTLDEENDGIYAAYPRPLSSPSAISPRTRSPASTAWTVEADAGFGAELVRAEEVRRRDTVAAALHPGPEEDVKVGEGKKRKRSSGGWLAGMRREVRRRLERFSIGGVRRRRRERKAEEVLFASEILPDWEPRRLRPAWSPAEHVEDVDAVSAASPRHIDDLAVVPQPSSSQILSLAGRDEAAATNINMPRSARSASLTSQPSIHYLPTPHPEYANLSTYLRALEDRVWQRFEQGETDSDVVSFRFGGLRGNLEGGEEGIFWPGSELEIGDDEVEVEEDVLEEVRAYGPEWARRMFGD